MASSHTRVARITAWLTDPGENNRRRQGIYVFSSLLILVGFFISTGSFVPYEEMGYPDLKEALKTINFLGITFIVIGFSLLRVMWVIIHRQRNLNNRGQNVVAIPMQQVPGNPAYPPVDQYSAFPYPPQDQQAPPYPAQNQYWNPQGTSLPPPPPAYDKAIGV